MNSIDEFARILIEEAKHFLEIASEHPSEEGQRANLHAAIMIGFCALEAHVNAIAEELTSRPELSAHEKGMLIERDVRLEDGEYTVSTSLKMTKLEDRVQFLHRRFTGKPIDRTSAWWGDLKSAMDHRNSLTHPKIGYVLSHSIVTRSLQAIIDTIDVLYKAIYKKPFPVAGRGLQSTLNF